MKNYYKVIKSRLITSVIMTNADNDVNINHIHYGCCTCWGTSLRDLGHNVDIHVYKENELLKISFISIDNEKIDI